MTFLPNKLRHKGAPWLAIQIVQPHGFVILQFNNNNNKNNNNSVLVWLTHKMNFLQTVEISAPKTVL